MKRIILSCLLLCALTAGGRSVVVTFVRPPASSEWTPPQSDSLITWVHCPTSDEVSAGTLTDDSGNSNNLTQSTSSYRGTAVTEDGYDAVKLDGSDDYYEIGTSAGQYPASNFTVVVVYRRHADADASDALYFLSEWPDASWDRTRFYASVADNLIYEVRHDTLTYASMVVGSSITTAAYHTAAAVYSENDAFTYWDETEVDTDTSVSFEQHQRDSARPDGRRPVRPIQGTL